MGTPVALAPQLLVALGFEAVLAVVLLFDRQLSFLGAVGTPLLSGLQAPLRLRTGEMKTLALTAALLLSVAGLLLPRQLPRRQGLG